nr:zinc finger protein 346 [Parasteatoda tepidariorum]
MQQSPTVRNSICKVCNMEFNGPEPYKQHMASARHHRNTSAVSKNAELGAKPKVGEQLNNVFKCNTCDKTFNGPLPYNEHLRSKAHKRTEHAIKVMNVKVKNTDIVEHFGQYFCDICNIYCNGAVPYEQHQNSKAHRNKLTQREAKY